MKNEEMKNEKNVILAKSYNFAKRIVKLYLHLSKEKNEYVLSKQLLRSGTSIGANIEEAQAGQSKKDFIAKTQISLKEAKETHYWLRLLRDTQIIEAKLADSLIKECEELLYILSAILKTAKK
jgi:four helix bundle protein